MIALRSRGELMLLCLLSLASTIDEHKYICFCYMVLYVTVRAGYCDTTEALLEMGVPVNENRSTVVQISTMPLSIDSSLPSPYTTFSQSL